MRYLPVLTVITGYLYFRISYPSSNDRLSLELSDDLLKYRHYNTSPFEENEVLPAFVDYHSMLRIAPKYGLSSCQTYKAMSTMRRSIFCLLYDADGFLAYNRTHKDEGRRHKYCGSNNVYYSIDEVDRILGKNYTNIVISRDPVDRFLSGFVHLCVRDRVCYGCGENMRCFLETLYSRYRSELMVRGRKIRQHFQDSHFAPQTWFCSLSTRFHDYDIIKYGNREENKRMTDQLLEIFKRNRVEPNLLEIIRKELEKDKTHHSTSGSLERQRLEAALMQDSYALSLLTKIYFFDFVVFGYDLPHF